jgi:hypothetical protein
MIGNPKVVGEANAFKWKVLDDYLAGSASRKMHAVFRVICHFPGNPINVPKYLLDAGARTLKYNGGLAPDYSDPLLVEAIQQFITSLGKRYDVRCCLSRSGTRDCWYTQCAL